MNKKTKIVIAISLLIILIIGLIFFMISVISRGTFNFISLGISSQVSTNLVYDEIYENNFSKISINSDSADIKIKQSTNEKIRVVIYSDEEDNDIIINNDTDLNISLKNKVGVRLFKFNHKNSKIEVYVPIDYNEKIEIENDYGDIEVDELIDANLNIESDCGNIKIENANTIKSKNSYGDTVINMANIVDVNSDCGDIEIGSVNSAKIKNSYGDIEIKNVNEYINIVADCGDIEIDNISLLKNSKIKNDFGDISIKNIKDVYVDAKVDLGEISIKNNSRTSNITLSIENDCGDVDVN